LGQDVILSLLSIVHGQGRGTT